MTISIKNAAVTITDQDGNQYHHDYVTNIAINNPRENALAISPQSGKGIKFENNITQPVAIDLIVRGMPADMVTFYTTVFESGERIDIAIVDASTGEHYYQNDAVIKSDPRNATISEGEASLDQPLAFIGPQASYSHGPA